MASTIGSVSLSTAYSGVDPRNDEWRMTSEQINSRRVLNSIAVKGLLIPGSHTVLRNATDSEIDFLCLNVLNLSMARIAKKTDLETALEHMLAVGRDVKKMHFGAVSGTEHSLKDLLLDESCPRVSWASIELSLTSLVSEPTTGALSVAAERSDLFLWKQVSELECELTRRVQSSVLLVFNPRASFGSLEEDPLLIKAIYDSPSKISHYEVRTKDAIPAKDLCAVITPLNLYGTVKSLFPSSVCLIPVEDQVQDVEIIPFGFRPTPRDLFHKLVAPDYLSGLKAWVRDFPGTLLGTHVVRLPVCSKVALVFEKAQAKRLEACLLEHACDFTLEELESEVCIKVAREDLEKPVGKDDKKIVRVRHLMNLTLMRAFFKRAHLEKLERLQQEPGLCVIKDESQEDAFFVYARNKATACKAKAIYES